MDATLEEIIAAAEGFLRAFELVFDQDWEYTLSNITGDARASVIAEGGTFILPGVSDEASNWANRAHLLAEYHRLVELVDPMIG